MEIRKSKTDSEDQSIEFADQTGTDMSLYVEKYYRQGKSIKKLFFDFETDYVEFTQEDIKQLLPYLQSFAEKGTLEPQESPSVSVTKDYGDERLQNYGNPQIGLTPLQGDTPEQIEQLLDSKDLTDRDRQAVMGMANMLASAQCKNAVQETRLLVKAAIEINSLHRQLCEEEKNIQALSQLVEEWRSLAESHKDFPDVLDSLQKRTAQLLGEE